MRLAEPPSLAGRAALAVALMIGFYLLALAIAGVLFLIPYWMWAFLNTVQLKIAAFCILGGLAIVWSVLPRVDRFEPPGPLLHPQRQPRLFQQIAEVARAVGQPMPAEVFLAPDVNAFVAQRGGIMGFGSRPVMGIGLPLLQVLTVTQLRAVLAHEFGHYHGGDTRLGPFVYKTRAAIGRTLSTLDDSILRLPFQWYGNAFLRVSHAVSRQQELSADALAAGLAGAAPLIAGLKATNGAATAFQAYWSSELAPVLNAGYRPPIAEGFQRFLAAPNTAALLQQTETYAMNEEKADPYDTHPPLRERVAALSAMPAGVVPTDDPPALSLLDGIPILEGQLLAAIGGAEASRLRALGWDEVASRVYVPLWQEHCRQHGEPLQGITAAGLPTFAAGDAPRVTAQLARKHGVPEDDARALLQHTIGAAVSLLFVEAGWTVRSDPGQPIELVKDGLQLQPFGLLDELTSGRLGGDEWRSRCTAEGLSDRPLVTRG